jgi:D-sedoheptulose 7-phosphate isomerase
MGCRIFESMISLIRQVAAESLALKSAFFRENETLIAEVAREICSSFSRGGKVLLFGNGGSAADAQHMAAELVGRFQRERRPYPAVALTTDSSVLTALGNDYGFDKIFARQIQALGRTGDIAVAISTSGNSPNVVEGAIAATEAGMVTVGLTGGDGGLLGTRVRYHLNVSHAHAARIQEVHIMVGHILCELVETDLKGL